MYGDILLKETVMNGMLLL